jgi:hypothetical protein
MRDIGRIGVGSASQEFGRHVAAAPDDAIRTGRMAVSKAIACRAFRRFQDESGVFCPLPVDQCDG